MSHAIHHTEATRQRSYTYYTRRYILSYEVSPQAQRIRLINHLHTLTCPAFLIWH